MVRACCTHVNVPQGTQLLWSCKINPRSFMLSNIILKYDIKNVDTPRSE